MLSKTDKITEPRVAVYGLGFVGLTLAVTLADAGFSVSGNEIRDEIRNQILNGEAPFLEPPEAAVD